MIEDLKLIIDEQDLRADFAGKFDFGEQITSIESQVDLPTLVGENSLPTTGSNANVLASVGGSVGGSSRGWHYRRWWKQWRWRWRRILIFEIKTYL